jgi:hypothetical protein
VPLILKFQKKIFSVDEAVEVKHGKQSEKEANQWVI